jgi:hypothetical protein
MLTIFLVTVFSNLSLFASVETRQDIFALWANSSCNVVYSDVLTYSSE